MGLLNGGLGGQGPPLLEPGTEWCQDDVWHCTRNVRMLYMWCQDVALGAFSVLQKMAPLNPSPFISYIQQLICLYLIWKGVSTWKNCLHGVQISMPISSVLTTFYSHSYLQCLFGTWWSTILSKVIIVLPRACSYCPPCTHKNRVVHCSPLDFAYYKAARDTLVL